MVMRCVRVRVEESGIIPSVIISIAEKVDHHRRSLSSCSIGISKVGGQVSSRVLASHMWQCTWYVVGVMVMRYARECLLVTCGRWLALS